MDPGRMIFHGNNKSRASWKRRSRAEVGLIAVDSLHELDAAGGGRRAAR